MLTVDIGEERHLERVAELAARSFRETYAWYNPPARIDAYIRDHLTVAQFRRELSEGITLLHAGHGAETVGYATLGPGPAPPAVTLPRPMELKRFYIDHAWHGHGFGRQLMNRVFDWAHGEGWRCMWLGVWEHNPRAIGFYEAMGFGRVGTIDFQFADDPQTDILMVRELLD
jgi:diamine N-acetyltransferase